MELRVIEGGRAVKGFERPTANANVVQPNFDYEPPKKRTNAAESLKRPEDIDAVVEYLVSHKRYRDNLIFVMGINFGLRCGDLLTLRYGNIIDENMRYRREVKVQEQKTKKRREKKGGVQATYRTVYLNDAVMDAFDLYCGGRDIDLNDYLFQSHSNNNSEAFYEVLKENGKSVKRYPGAAIGVGSVERMLKKVINEELGIDVRAGTHLLRKTFGYHVWRSAPDKNEAIDFLQKVLGHSSRASTMAYIGITAEDVRKTCEGLNLGAMTESKYMGRRFA